MSCPVKVTVGQIGAVKVSTSASSIAPTPPYTGAYEWTPTNSVQTISIANLRATQDITINPIPSNWGLITWDGSSLTVS